VEYIQILTSDSLAYINASNERSKDSRRSPSVREANEEPPAPAPSASENLTDSEYLKLFCREMPPDEVTDILTRLRMPSLEEARDFKDGGGYM
jgi:hypothetical protein